MSRRPPIDDRELLTLMDQGMGQSEAARQMGRSVKTIGGQVLKLRADGILPEGDTRPVNWAAFEEWEKSASGLMAASQAKRQEPEAETSYVQAPPSDTQAPLSDSQDKPVIQTPKTPPETRKTSPSDRLTVQDVADLEKLLAWWRERKLRITPVSDSAGRKAMLSIRIPEALMAELKIEAKAAQMTLTEVAVNRLTEVSFTSYETADNDTP